MERSSRLRMGCLDAISILPPRCIRKVRSETLPRLTPSIPRSFSTISSACAVEVAAMVTSIRSFSWPEAVTSRPVTDPPEDSTAVVSWETAVPLAGTSRRTVIEYETLGAVAMAVFLFFCPWFAVTHRAPLHSRCGRTCCPIVPPTSQYKVTSYKIRKDSSTIRDNKGCSEGWVHTKQVRALH